MHFTYRGLLWPLPYRCTASVSSSNDTPVPRRMLPTLTRAWGRDSLHPHGLTAPDMEAGIKRACNLVSAVNCRVQRPDSERAKSSTRQSADDLIPSTSTPDNNNDNNDNDNNNNTRQVLKPCLQKTIKVLPVHEKSTDAKTVHDLLYKELRIILHNSSGGSASDMNTLDGAQASTLARYRVHIQGRGFCKCREH